jgi:hypothetical protein
MVILELLDEPIRGRRKPLILDRMNTTSRITRKLEAIPTATQKYAQANVQEN